MILCEIGLFHIVWCVSIGTHDHYHEICKNNVLGTVNINFGGGMGWGVTCFMLHFLLIIYKNGKSIRAWPILKSNSTSFSFNFFFLGWIIKKHEKGPHSYFFRSYKFRSIIAVLLTPGITWIHFLIQICIKN